MIGRQVIGGKNASDPLRQADPVPGRRLGDPRATQTFARPRIGDAPEPGHRKAVMRQSGDQLGALEMLLPTILAPDQAVAFGGKPPVLLQVPLFHHAV